MRYLILMVALAGCASAPPHIAASTPSSVIVGKDALGPVDVSELLPVAEKACAEHSKHARYYKQVSAQEWQFDCVN